MKLVEINGKAGLDDGYYDGSTSMRACKPVYVPSLHEQKAGVDLKEAAFNTRDLVKLDIVSIMNDLIADAEAMEIIDALVAEATKQEKE